MNTEAFIELCISRSISFSLAGNDLKLHSEPGALNDELLAEIRDRKQELIALLQSKQEHHIVPRYNLQEKLPLSYGQQRLWVVNQLEPNATNYNMTGAFQIEGKCEVSIVEKTLKKIVERHEILRTNFIATEGRVEQIPHDDFTLEFKVIDASAFSRQEQKKIIDKTLKQESFHIFDLANDPLIRAVFIMCNELRAVMVLNMHHIVSDARSLDIMKSEFAQIYNAQINNCNDVVVDLPIQYADYAVWQRKLMSGENFQSKMKYWVNELNGIPDLHNIPLQNPRPREQDYSASHVVSAIDGALFRSAKQFADSKNITHFMLLQSMFALLLSRYSSENDIVMGVPHAGRNQSEIESLVGFFVNLLVFRTHIDENQTIDQYLEYTKQKSLMAFTNQDVPFELLVDQLKSNRTLSYNPICQIKFMLEKQGESSDDIAGLKLEPIDNPVEFVRFDLDLSVTETVGGFECRWTYKKQLFSKRTIEKMAAHYINLLSEVVRKSTAKIRDLNIINNNDWDELLRLSKGEKRVYPTNNVIDLIEKRVKVNPNNIAVRDVKHQITYDELNVKANRLADVLAEQGIEENEAVAICLTKSPLLLVAILAVMKAGARYIPVDINSSKTRIKQIFENAGVSQVLTTQSCLSKLPAGGVDFVTLDNCYEEDWLAEYNAKNTNIKINSGNGAYIVYTSGSTGVPKGVEVSHGNLADYCQSADTCYYQEHLQGSLVITSHAFDITVPSIFLPLIKGDKVEFLDEENPYLDLADRMQRHVHAYLLRMTPAHVEALLAYLPNEFKSTARHTFVIGGENFPVSLADALQKKFIHSHIYNHYGPSEVTIGCVLHKFNMNLDGKSLSLPIGRPMVNHDVFILDSYLRVLPIGCEGQLFVSGAGVTKGYLNNEALTKDKFIANPFGYGVLYATGDRVRWNKDGELEFLGRIDDQLKLRGYRIEPGEIENLILKNVDVRSCVVSAYTDRNNQSQLIAYFVQESNSRQEEGNVIRRLKEELTKSLPDYMIPVEFIALKRWQLNANGKINRKALPTPNYRHARPDYRAPETGSEMVLSELWSKLLKIDVDKIGALDDFFSIGGNSLLAIRLVAEVRKRLGVDIKIKDIFDQPTLLELANILDSASASNDKENIITSELGDGYTAPLSFSQRRLWFIDKLTEGSSEYNIPIAYSVRGEFDIPHAEHCFQEIVERHKILRTVYRETEEGAEQVINEIEPFQIEILKINEEDGLQKIVDQHAQYVFDLSHDLMIRVGFIQPSLSNDFGILLINVHHIAADGWSLRILIKEFSQLYGMKKYNGSPQLQPLNIQYADYAFWQLKNEQGEKSQITASYWEARLAGIPPVHSLPLDNPRPPVKQGLGKRHGSTLGRSIVSGLRLLAGRHGMTPFMLIHAALSLVLSRHSGSNDIIIGTPTANRLNVQLEPLIGFFVNTLVLRVNTAYDELDDYLSHVREVHIGALDNQNYPFEKLVETLNIVRTPAHTPIFQIMLTTNTHYGIIEKEDFRSIKFAGAEFEAISPNTISSKFDIEIEANIGESDLTINWIYDVAIFKDEHITQLDTHLTNLLESIVANTENQTSVPIASLSMMSKKEIKYLVNDLNDTKKDIPIEQCLHSLFLESVVKHPHAVAIRDRLGSMTYAEVFTHALELCMKLESFSLKEEELIAVQIEKDRWQVIAVLGIMMAGAAYLPMEVSWPKQRRQKIVEKGGCRLILVSDGGSGLDGVTEVTLMQAQKDVSPALNRLRTFKAKQNPESLAYVIFTSGSTGEPKGVAVEHRSVVNTILDINHQYKIDSNDKVLAVSALSFDLSVYDIFGLLTAGGEIVMPDHEHAADPEHWLEEIEKYQVTLWNTVPVSASLLAEQLEYLDRKSSAPLRNILMSGDWIDPGLPKRLWALFPGVKTWSLGGATEGSIWSIHYPITEDTSGLKSIPYGKPLSNQRFYIINEQQLLVPAGIVGELCIAGEGVARHYFNDKERSAERFIYHPQLKQKIYRTGDLGRYMSDGNIEFLGRKDDQVKINGFRIELGEIEKLVSACKGVESSFVKSYNNGSNRIGLIAYVRPEGDSSLTGGTLALEIKEQLLDNLPAYMVPDMISLIDTWPLTPNGKVDIKALPEPDNIILENDYCPAKTETESKLLKIWSELLNISESRISTKINFFEANGNSLLATRLVFKVKQSFNVGLQLRVIYKHNTINSLAKLIDQRKSLELIEEQLSELNGSDVEEIVL